MSRQAFSMVSIVVSLAVSACSVFQQTPQQRAEAIEPMLSAAGFHMKPADTPERLNHLQSLTPLKLRYYTKDGKFLYWFADPDYCHCLFVGDEAAYQRYQNLRLQSEMEQRAQETAMINQEAMQEEQMNWMMWPYDPYFF